MTAQIRWFWARLNANYWFYPALFSGLAAVMAFTLVYLDRHGFSDHLGDLRWIELARPDGASNMLSVIAGSMIAVASTVFSITIVAVSFASGTYGPRLLTNFMEDKGNQFSLATFIGTFVYAITVLGAVRGADEGVKGAAAAGTNGMPGFVPQLSLLMAYALMAVSVAVLVYFLNHIPSGIRINTVLKTIGTRLIDGIKDTYPDQGSAEDDLQRPEGTPVLAREPGYVQLIEFDELAEIGAEHECQIVLKIRTGDFVHPGMELLQVSGGQDASDIEEELLEQFTFGASRTPEQDAEFLIDELVEIGLRALSPGINDPFTAITALHWLGAATAELGCRNLTKNICADEAQDCRVYPLPDDFNHYVARGFGAIRSAAATSPIAAKVMLDALRNAAAPMKNSDRITALQREGQHLRDQARLALKGPDLLEVEERFTSFNRAVSQTP